MLDEFQTSQVWENMLAAETRSLYFADLTSRYTRTKQWMTGISFFLASGAAASIIGKLPQSVPLIASAVVAVLTAYSIAMGLDRKIGTMAKLHSTWNMIAVEYQRLWSHTYSDDAEEQLYALIQREREPSELATMEAPNNQKLLGEWQEHVFEMYHLTRQSG